MRFVILNYCIRSNALLAVTSFSLGAMLFFRKQRSSILIASLLVLQDVIFKYLWYNICVCGNKCFRFNSISSCFVWCQIDSLCVTPLSGFARGNMIDCLTWSRHSFTPMQFIQRGLSGLLETNGRLWLDYLSSFAVNYTVANLEFSATEWLFWLLLAKSNGSSLHDNTTCFANVYWDRCVKHSTFYELATETNANIVVLFLILSYYACMVRRSNGERVKNIDHKYSYQQ